MSAADQHSILWRGEDPLTATIKPLYNADTKIPRYWPGRLPHWVDEDEYQEESSEEEDENEPETEIQDKRLQRIVAVQARQVRRADFTTRHPEEGALTGVLDADAPLPEVKEDKGDLRLRPSAHQKETPEATQSEQIPLVKEEEEQVEETLDEIDERRKKARQIALQKRKAEEEEMTARLIAQREDEETQDEDEDSSVMSESGDEDPIGHALARPVFVRKEARDTVKEREVMEAEQHRQEAKRLEELSQRKRESQQKVVELIMREEEEMANAGSDESDTEMPDDDDEVDEEGEYELWKIRELKRIKRDKENRDAAQRFVEEVERRRNMTDEQRRDDDRKIEAEKFKPESKHKFGFLQKYYHKGAYFQDKAQDGVEPLYLRDYQAPVGEDALDKKAIPAPMRLRRGQFGKIGQVKHTHLTDVDTTDFNAPWTFNDKIRTSYLHKMGGIKGSSAFQRPSGSGGASSSTGGGQ